MIGLYHIARSQREHDIDMMRPLVVHGHTDPDPSIRDLARQLERLLTDRRTRGIPTTGVDV